MSEFDLMRPHEAAKALCVSVPTVNRMVRAGLLKRIKIGARATAIVGVRQYIESKVNENKVGDDR